MLTEGSDLLVGLIGLGLLPLIGLRIRRGLREGRLPLYRTCHRREEGEATFRFLLAAHAFSFALVAAMTADLLLDLGIREAL